MKKVLIIAYLYPPIFNSGTRRSLEFVNHLPDSGWEPTVLTVADPNPQYCDASLLDEVRPGTRIERTPYWSARLAAMLAPLSARDPKSLAQALDWRVRKYWNIPDEVASWAPGAVARGKELLGAERYDAIYATGWPWTSFLIAEKISRATGVPFVVDYRDLWKPADVAWDQATSLQRRFNPRLERRVLRAAAGVIATTPTFLTLLPREVLPPLQFAITNGFDEKDFPARANASAPAASEDTVRIAYTGVWRPGYGPDDLFAAVRQVLDSGVPLAKRLQLVVAGFPPGRAEQFGIASCVEELGRIPHAQATGLMSTADAVYLPVSKGIYEMASIPGKLFEYLGSGSPILASAQAGSEVAQVVEEVGGARRIEPGDVGALAQLLIELCNGKREAVFSPRNEAALARYTRSRLTQQLGAALDKVAATTGKGH